MRNTRKTKLFELRRGLALLVALALCISLFPPVIRVNAETLKWTGGTAPTGAGTAEDPYQITSAGELTWLLNTTKTGHAKIMNDIDLAGRTWVGGSFSGTLDGDGHMITGLNIGSSTSDRYQDTSGFVGLVTKLTGTVKNLAVEVCIYVTSTKDPVCVGGIAGQNSGTIDNCTVTGVIDVSNELKLYVGGITGQLAGGSITNCVNRANVTGYDVSSGGKNTRIGGIAGDIGPDNAVTISNCANFGNITLAQSKRGKGNCVAAGICVDNFGKATINNCYNAGTVSYDSTNAVNGTAEQIVYIKSGAATVVNSAYYLDGSQYIKYEATSTTFTDNAAMLAELNANVTAAGADSGWLTWVLGNDGYPVPGADLLPVRLAGTVTIAGDAKYGETLTATVANCNVESGLTYQWRRSTADGFEAISNANGSTYTLTEEDIGHTLQFLVSCENYDNVLTATTAVVTKSAGPEAPSVTGTDASSAAANDGKLVGTTSLMEYSSSVDFSTAVDCTDGETTGLAPGIYYVRVKATATVEAGAYVQIIIRDATAPELGYWTDDGNYTSGDLAGSGTEADPYLLSSAADLAKLAVQFNTAELTLGKYFKITASEIDLSAHEWVPVTNFAGVLDGNNAAIRGLWVGTELMPRAYENAGLFGTLDAGSVVKDLQVSGSIQINRSADVNAGMIAGVVSGTIDHCVVAGEINVVTTGTPSVGGIVGRVTVDSTDVRLINLASSVEIYALGGAANAYSGGVLGFVDHRPSDTTDLKTVAILNCYNTGNVSAGVTDDNDDSTTSRRARAGGIAGWLRGLNGDTVSVTIQNCYNTGTPTIHSIDGTTKGTVDGIVGAAQSAFTHFANCYSWSGVAKASDYATVDGKISGEQMGIADLQSEDFALTLTINANALVASGYGGLYAWTVSEGSTPVFADTTVTGNAVSIQVGINSARLGSVKVEVSAAGTGDYTDLGQTALIEKGDSVRITFLPTVGCAVASASSNGTAVTVENNVYTFSIQESTVIDVVFEVVSTVDVDAIYIDCDAAAGGDGTLSSPYRTLEEARAKIRSVIASTPTANLTVYLMGGTYVLEETFSLGLEESSLGRLSFQNYNSEEVIITSAHAVSGAWTKVSGKNYYSYQLPKNTDGNYPAFRDLLVNGERAQLAKSQEYTYKWNWVNAVFDGSSIDSCDNLLYISADALSGITNENLTGVEIGQLMEWKSQIFHIAQLTGETKDGELQIQLDQTEFETLLATDTTMKDLTGRVYWLQNHINFLDEPGEFYYDRSTGTVYYYPMSDVDMATAQIAYATLDYLVELENAANITFDGITFTGTTANDITENGLITHLGNTYRVPVTSGTVDAGRNVPYAAIHGISNVEGVEVLNCVFTELGGSAMIFDYGIKDLTITGNTIKDLAMAGIQIGRNQRSWNQGGEIGSSEDIVITNNYITNIGLVVYGAPGIRVARCKNLDIQYNTIIHVPYSAIMAGYGWNVNATSESHNTNLINADISYNYIEDYLFKINDGGAIYTCGANDFTDNTELFNEIHHNYVRAGAHNKTYTGIYHDGSASNWHTHHNVIDDLKSTKGPMFFQDDVANQNTHNITVANNYTSVSEISTSATADRNIMLENNTKVADRAALLAIPEAKAIMDGAGLQAAYAHIADPMDVSLQIQDDTMHYGINDDQQGSTVANVKVTNNYNTNKRFTLSVTGDLPSFVTYTVSGNGVELAPGASALITVTFAADPDSFFTTDDVICGFAVTEENGAVTEFPRQFTLYTRVLTGINIAYGTPTIDGYLDDAYRNSVYINLSTDVTGGDYKDATTNTSGNAYLLWDEQYLYAYVTVYDTTVKTRGIEYITTNYANGTGNPNNLWRTDAVEAYIYSTHRGKETKFGVDAFGIQPFTNSNVAFSVVDALPYATKFTYEGEILDDYVVENPTAGQTAATDRRSVNGYVIEMTLPLTTCLDLAVEGTPQAGDVIRFYIQLNDYTSEYTAEDGSAKPNVVCLLNGVQYFTLVSANDSGDCSDGAHGEISSTTGTDEYGQHYTTFNCGACGAEIAKIAHYGQNLRLQDLIKIGYYFSVDSEESGTVGALLWTEKDYLAESDHTISSESAKKYTGLTASGGLYSIETDGVFAQNLDTVYYMIPYIKTADGEYYYGAAQQYSALTYAEKAYSSAGTSADLKSLVADMVNYATAARAYFCITENLDTPANAFNLILDEADRTVEKDDSLCMAFPEVDVPGDFEVEYYGRNINLLDAISAGIYFSNGSAIKGGYYWNTADVTAAKAGDVTITDAGNGYVKASVPELYAYNIYDSYYVRVYDADGVLSDAYSVNVAAYLSKMIETHGESEDQELQAMVALSWAMLKYGHNAQSSSAINH